jgi:PAS domain S-box-containing protein
MSSQYQQTNSNYNFLSNNLIMLFDNHTDAICVMDWERRILYANQAISNRLGYSNEELLNIKFDEIISTDAGLEIFNYYFQRALESDTQEFIAEIKAKDGKSIEMKITTVSNEVEGKIVSVSGFLTDITTQTITTEGTSPLSKDLCESFIENNRDPILLLNLDAIIVLANHSFSELLGWRKENLEGFHILQCPSIPPDLIGQMDDYYRRVRNGEPNLETLQTVRIDTEGTSHYMMLSITPIHDANDQLCNWAVHLRDITRQIEAEQALLRSNTLLDHGQISDVVDQIRSRLESMKGMVVSINGNAHDYNNVGQITEQLLQIENLVNLLSIQNERL